MLLPLLMNLDMFGEDSGDISAVWVDAGQSFIVGGVAGQMFQAGPVTGQTR